MVVKKIHAPLGGNDISALRSGDTVSISGVIYIARDAAHKKMIDALGKGDGLPFNPEGQIIYYCGPSPAGEGQVIGAAGPTTSNRMDVYTPLLLACGMKASIGKGSRSEEVRKALCRYKGVYLAAIGGCGALLSRRITACEIIAYPELGPEAIHRLEVKNFPAIVVNDMYGNDLYEEGRKRFEITDGGEG
ncbi:MAG: TRZ/ATZ family protein [Firmicutes bacterium]|nr:TRZ/ATZ family protein [Bacillota bacterium]